MKTVFILNEGCFPNITVWAQPFGFRIAWKRPYPSAKYALAREWGYWGDRWHDRQWVVLAGPCKGVEERK